ncbi:MAG TPA: hypothetical protein VG755_41360 [Nannocystaceae bacterium]|nr:hypothetical protein [Nannocystaceae bacterium]
MAARVLCCALCVGLLGCGSDIIEHGALDPSDSTVTSGLESLASMTSFGEVDGGTMSGAGNYPEPALTRCGELGDDIYDIGELRSAWSVVAIGGTEDTDGEVEAGTIRLRLSDGAMGDCQDPLDLATWGFALTLAPDETSIGIHDFADLFAPDLELVQDGERRTQPISGTLRLVRVTQDCVVGVLSSVVQGSTPMPQLSGGFAAEVCTRDCLPTASQGC